MDLDKYLWKMRVSYNGNTSAFPACHGLSGISTMVVWLPSKEQTPVRFRYPACAMAGRQADAGGSIPPTRCASAPKPWRKSVDKIVNNYLTEKAA